MPPKRENNRWTDTRTLRTTATPQQVFEAWADPELLAQWFPEAARGEAVPGGTMTYVFSKFGIEMVHQVVEVVPGERLVLDGKNPAGLPFRQEIAIRREGGETVLELVHSGFDDGADWGDDYEGADSGWAMALAILRHYLEHHFGRPRTNYFVMRPASYEFAQLDALYRSEAGLSKWLTRSGRTGEVGDEVALELRDGGRVTGEVLAWTGRECAVSWREIAGVLELKAFPMGPGGRAIALRGSSWSDAAPAEAEIEAWMSAALDRLAAHTP